MREYFVNRNPQPNGDHEVHADSCAQLPALHNRHPLGEHPNCHSAVRAAKRVFLRADGCVHCANPCHTS